MRVLGIVAFLLVALLVVFVLLNWGAINVDSELNLGVTRAHAPLGLVLLAALGLLTIAFTTLLVTQQALALVQLRRAARQIQDQRALADKAEESRFTELRAYLEAELRKLQGASAGSADGAQLARFEERLARLDHDLAGKLSEVANGLFAHLGEVEDKIDRALQGRSG